MLGGFFLSCFTLGSITGFFSLAFGGFGYDLQVLTAFLRAMYNKWFI
jgi:hypothetical protein